MYKIIAVDDELLALKRFEYIIRNEKRVELVATFSDPLEALEYVKNNTVDLAFLDIEMPSLNGLELAERLLEVDPYISIVFITAFDQYALQAFQAHAIGYLLKPLSSEDFADQIQIISHSKQPRVDSKVTAAAKEEPKLTVKCIGQFTCYTGNDELHPISFRTNKTMELFALLVHHYSTPLSKYTILDALFPDIDDEKANKLFYVSCSYLRSSFAKLNLTEILIRENDTYRLNTDQIDCDYIKLMEGSSKLQDLELKELEELSKLITGEYLMGKAYEWAFETKAYIESLSMRILRTLSTEYDKAGDELDSTMTLEKYLIIDPCNDSIVEELIKKYLKNGQQAKAKIVYSTYADKLQTLQGLTPSSSIKALIK